MKSITLTGNLAVCALMLVLFSSCCTTPEEKLRLAAAEGNLLRVQTFLGQGISPQVADERGITPIFIAAQEGQREVVALLLKNGADVNTRAGIGEVTLLHVAAYRGDQELIPLLLQYGANTHAGMTSRERPVDLAQAQGHTALIPRLEP